MGRKNQCLNIDIDLLNFLGALLMLLGDFIAYLVAYQQLCNSKEKGDTSSASTAQGDFRLSQEFR